MVTRFGPYQLISLLGRGGMGEVWEAVDTPKEDRRRVALKLLSPDALCDPELERRFRQECNLAASIEHQHVLLVFDYEVDGRPWIAMPLIPASARRCTTSSSRRCGVAASPSDTAIGLSTAETARCC
jgi:serine/threonine protein kinase